MRAYVCIALSSVLVALASLSAGCNGERAASPNHDGGPANASDHDGDSDDATSGGDAGAEGWDAEPLREAQGPDEGPDGSDGPPDTGPDGGDAEALDAPPPDAALDDVADASCLPPPDAAPTFEIGGSFRILSLSETAPDAGRTRCGDPLMNVKVEFLPNGVSCPSGPVIVNDLDFAGSPLAKPCSDRLGLQVGGVYSHAALSVLDGRLYVEYWTQSESDYDFCYSSTWECGSDAGAE
jgi:hypothetical protein